MSYIRRTRRSNPVNEVGTALLRTLEQGLEPAFTPEIRDACTEAYLYVSTIARRATMRAFKEFQAIRASPENPVIP